MRNVFPKESLNFTWLIVSGESEQVDGRLSILLSSCTLVSFVGTPEEKKATLPRAHSKGACRRVLKARGRSLGPSAAAAGVLILCAHIMHSNKTRTL